MTTKYLKQSGGGVIEAVTVATSAGAGDADKIPSLDASGRLDVSMLPGQLMGLNNDVAISTSPTTLFSCTLSGAGRYRVGFTVRFRGTSGTAFNTLTISCAHGSLTEAMGSWTRSKRNQTVDTGATYSSSTLVTSRGAPIGDVHTIEFGGHVIVTGSGTLTFSAVLDAGGGNALPGSYAQVVPESTSTTLQGYANSISITSGVGYAGSVLTSTNAAQWTANGSNISGQTGTTYTVTRDVEGQAIRCGNSNTIQMWTPLLLPDVFKTDGTNFGGWWDIGNSASVTLNGSNIASVANLFSGGPALVQATTAAQPAYNAGGYIDFPQTANAPNATYGLLAASAICLRYVAAVVQYAQGTQTTFAGYNLLLADSTGTVFNISGNQNNNAFVSGDTPNQSVGHVAGGDAVVNGDSLPQANVLPFPKGLLEFRTRKPATAVGPYCTTAAACWRGPLYEFLTLAAVPAGEIAARLQGYMMWHNGIQTSLPPSHVYYAAPPRVSH